MARRVSNGYEKTYENIIDIKDTMKVYDTKRLPLTVY